MRIASSLLGGGAECIRSKLADDAKQVGVTEGPTAVWRDLDRLEKWADRNPMKFNRNCRVLQLGRNSPRYHYPLGAEQRKSNFAEKDVGALVDTKLIMH